MNAADVAAVLRGYRYTYRSEDDLQEAVAAALDAAGVPAAREVRLDGRSRIDVLAGRVGVEVKLRGTPAAAGRQLRRYLAHPAVDEVVLVTARGWTAADLGADVEVVAIARAGL